MKTSVIIFLAAAACSQFNSSADDADVPKPGQEPPPLGFEAILQAPGGAEPSWKALKGKVVVLEFWATWCGPCIAAIPHLNELADKFKDEPIQFIAITDQDEKVLGPFLKKKPMHAWIGLDTDRSMFKDYGIRGIPHTVVVDAKGMIAAITHPTYLTEEQLRDVLAGKTIASAQPAPEGRLPVGRGPDLSKPEHEALFQVTIRPSDGGSKSSSSGGGGLTVSRVTVLEILSSVYSINPTRIVTHTAVPEGKFDFIIKTPGWRNETAKAWLR